MIPESFVQDLLARVDVVDVVGRYVQLRKAGANLLGLCPFHNEKSPSFTVSPSKQFYHCFGCGAHGSAISFLIEHTGASFPEAIRALAATTGMVVPENNASPQQRAQDHQRKQEALRHQQVLDRAQSHYVKELKASSAAINYVKNRGLNGQTASRFGLGWSGTDRRGLAHVFSNYEDAALIESGLVIEADDGRRYDRFRERVMFPIRNTRGKLIGFGGRIIGKGEPKYLNSPETSLFSKGHELYGLWEARSAIRAEGCVLVVEGYMDVVSLAQQGVENAVATLGTATTPMHVQKLLRASDKVIFSFDGDKAGRRAAWRALQQGLALLRDDVSLRFLFLPSGHDPDSYVREFGPEAFRACMAEATPLSRFLLDELASRHAMDEAEGRAACVYEAKPLLALLPEGALRLQIEREFAQQVRLTPEELAGMLAQAPATDPGIADQGRPSAVDDNPFSQWSGQQGRRQHNNATVSDTAPRSRPSAAGRHQGQSRMVTPMAKRLLRLLLAHPELVTSLGDQELEIVCRSPHLVLVRDLIALINGSGARHIGALLQATDPGTDLHGVLQSLSAELLADDDLPSPQAEFNDALRHIELAAVKAEQNTLIEAGLTDDAARKRYHELTRRITLLSGGASLH